jgi:transketolase
MAGMADGAKIDERIRFGCRGGERTLMNGPDIGELERTARRLRSLIVRGVGVGQKGHLGGSCSIADVVTALYFYKMRHDAKRPDWPERDRFVLSKGHVALVQYAALALSGYFPEEDMDRVKHLGCHLQGHPDFRKTVGVEANTGSLGQGFSMACGMAAGVRIDGYASRVYCVLGDGEIAEGQVWEASMAAAQFKLDNLVAILDSNRIQATGACGERFNTYPHREKWESFGWKVDEVNGHDMGAIVALLDRIEGEKGRPHFIIAHTVKGKGVSFAEGKVAFHNGTLTREQREQALKELEEPAEALA